ncbi:MAG: NADH-quinone oxidoreductase subunit J [Methylacidiphilales bacterium]|nr:NADH-quinone oxidoreductase subunit J [Candidatus Methylacidiphilales bacterium]
MEALFFWIFAAGLIVSACAVVLNRNPVASALSLVVAFGFLAALFLTLEAFFLAVVQIIVYAGAVMVLFLFIIMLLDIQAAARRPFPYLQLVFVAVVSGAFGFIFLRVLSGMPHTQEPLHWGRQQVAFGAKEVGNLLFSKYILPFEITAVLLLVATLGVILLSKREVK